MALLACLQARCFSQSPPACDMSLDQATGQHADAAKHTMQATLSCKIPETAHLCLMPFAGPLYCTALLGALCSVSCLLLFQHQRCGCLVCPCCGCSSARSCLGRCL